MTEQLVHPVPPRCDADSASADAAPALKVRRSVADDDHTMARYLEAEHLPRTPLRDCRELGTLLVIRSEGPDPEHVGVDSHRAQLDSRALNEITREEAE